MESHDHLLKIEESFLSLELAAAPNSWATTVPGQLNEKAFKGLENH